MGDSTDRGIVERSRAALADATSAARRLGREAALARAELVQLQRTHGADDEQVRLAQARLAQNEKALQGARAAVGQARGGLAATLATWIGDDAAADLARLRADLPLVLLPVRLETRFVVADGGAQLLVRVYPDTIHGTAHDPLLTQAEVDLGEAYWARAWAGDEAQAWRELVRKVAPPRAAWIVRTLEPTNLASRPAGEPAFATVELRTGAWDRASEAHLLPDRFVVLAFRGGVEVRRVAGGAVREPLIAGFDPQAPPGEGIDVSGDGLVLDEDVLWAVDFAQAETAGMGLRVPLGPDDAQLGFDRVMVLGVKGSLAPQDGQARLQDLLDAHHYSGGLAFLAQGTPTNNTENAPSAYPPPDPDGARSFAIERGPELDDPAGDGVRAMQALGLDTALVKHIDGAQRQEQAIARAMAQALWPATFGYYLQQMLAPQMTPEAIEAGRQYFADHVRGRGPLPAMRVRTQPYGILPVGSLDRWQPRRGAGSTEVEIMDLLRRLRPLWLGQVARVPRVGATSDPDADLLAILGMDASAREVRVRTVNGPDFRRNFFAFAGLDGTTWEAAQLSITNLLMPLLGLNGWDPRLLHVHFADVALRFRFPLVAPAPLSEGAGLEAAFGFDYVRWIREASIDDLRNERLPDGRPAPQALLYRMLRHARLAELARVGIDIHISAGVATAAERFEPELVSIAPATAARPTVWERFSQPVGPVTGTLTLGEFLVTSDTPATIPLREHDAALEALEGLTTAELERLFGETLDVSSHRLDAWMTSLATKRLLELRQANPNGVYVGAFGWVEDLRPEPAGRFGTTQLLDGRTVRMPVDSGGFIQAPSMQHASAAAVLRNGYLTRSGEQGTAYRIDLSSQRVRSALTVLDAVREGQPAGAVLGYQLERGLHDRRVDWFIEPLRRRFPPVANKSGDADLDGPPDAIAARNVVDGVALRRAFVDGKLDLTQPDFLHDGAPPSAAELAAVTAELRRLDDALDAVTDLLTAESVYQLVAGNTAGANAGLDAMAKGERPTDPEIAIQPRPGIPITHRVAVVLGGDPPIAPGWSMPPTPRARAEPWLDGWMGLLLGDPATVRCRVALALPDGTSVPDQDVTLDALDVRPIDVLALVRAMSAQGALLAELDARVAAAALAVAPPGAAVTAIRYERDPAWSRDTIHTFPEIFEIARAIDRLLGGARALTTTDLASSTTGLPTSDPIASEAADRAGHARADLLATHDALAQGIADNDTAAVATALRTASLFGVASAFPRGDVAPDAAAAALAALAGRLAQASAAPDPTAVVTAVFGGVLPFLPRFTPPFPAELGLALAAGPGLVGDAQAPRRWIYGASRVRAALGRWRALDLRTAAFGTQNGVLDVAQLPHRADPGARWVALPFPPGGAPAARTLSLALHRVATPAPQAPWTGLLLDEWNEVIPSAAPTTGIAFHFDAPGSEPPQSVLVAVPSTLGEAWSVDDLVATVSETLDLAKIRAVDAELLGVIGQLLPTIYLAGNAANDTVSTGFHDALVVDFPLVASTEA